MKLILIALLLPIACATGLKADSTDDQDGCQEGYKRDLDYNCVVDDGCNPGYERDINDNCVSSSTESNNNGPDDCTSDLDCTIDKCPDDSTGCICLESDGFCVPSCLVDEDCPSVDDTLLICDPDGICTPQDG